MIHRRASIFGSLFIVIAIISGAFGAHWLKDKISTDSIRILHTASSYLFSQGLGLFFLSIWYYIRKDNKLYIPITLIILGTILFSGSILLLSLKSLFVILPIRLLGPLTPLGGLLLIIGWIWVFYLAIRRRDPQISQINADRE